MFRKTLTNAILLGIEKSIDGYIRLEDFLYNPGYYAYWDGWNFPLEKSELSQAIKRLRERGFIEKETERDSEKIILKLTQVGQEYLFLSKSDDEVKWDGKWRIVVFDIPEKQKPIRNILRNRLKIWGFKPWQKSVWASKKDISHKLRLLMKELKIEDWVLVIESDNIGR